MEGGVKNTEQKSSQWCTVEGQEIETHIETQEIPFKHQEKKDFTVRLFISSPSLG